MRPPKEDSKLTPKQIDMLETAGPTILQQLDGIQTDQVIAELIEVGYSREEIGQTLLGIRNLAINDPKVDILGLTKFLRDNNLTRHWGD